MIPLFTKKNIITNPGYIFLVISPDLIRSIQEIQIPGKIGFPISDKTKINLTLQMPDKSIIKFKWEQNPKYKTENNILVFTTQQKLQLPLGNYKIKIKTKKNILKSYLDSFEFNLNKNINNKILSQQSIPTVKKATIKIEL